MGKRGITDKSTHIVAYRAKDHSECPVCHRDVYDNMVMSHYNKACHLHCYEPYKSIKKAEKAKEKIEEARQYLGELFDD